MFDHALVRVSAIIGLVVSTVAVPAALGASPGQAAPAPAAVSSSGTTVPVASLPGELPGAGGELVSRRTPFSRTFQDPDGTARTVVGTVAQNVTGPAGSLIPVDTTLVPAGRAQQPALAGPAGTAFVTSAGSAVLSVPGAAGGPVRVTGTDGTWVQTQLAGAVGSPTVKDSTATVPNALPGTSVAWTSTAGGLKEVLTLGSPSATSTVSYGLTLSAGLTPVKAEDGSIRISDSRGSTVWNLPAPFMDDAAGAHSDAVSYQLSGTAGAWRLLMTADPTWLADPARVFPVKLDPTVLISGTGSGVLQDLACEIRSNLANTNYCTAATFDIGAASGSVRRAVLRFPQLHSVIPANAVLAQAQLELPVTAVAGSGTLTVQAKPLTGDFTSAATWNTRNGGTGWVGGGGAAGQTTGVSAGSVTLAGSPVGTTPVLYISDLARAWLAGSTPDFGVLLQSTNEATLRSASFSALTATCTVGSCGTRLSVAYLERLGAYNGSQFYDVPITDSSNLQVNLATGNLFIAATDLGVTRTWNSKRVERVGQIGRGWNFGAGRDTIATVQPDGAIRYYAPGGGMYLFTPKAGGGFSSPPGLTATATDLGGGNITIKFERSASTFTFAPPQGQLVSSTDRNGNTISYTYKAATSPNDAAPFSDVITDPAGRTVTASNNGTFLTGLADSASRTTGYTYTSVAGGVDLLGIVTDANSQVTTYGYDNFGRINRVTTPEGRAIRFGYDSTNRVTSIIRVDNPAGDGGLGSGPTTNFAYTPITPNAAATPPVVSSQRGTTVVTDPNSNATTYKHDFSGQITTVTNPLGFHRDTEYGPDNNITKAYDAMGVGTGMGAPTEYTYDADFRLTAAKSPMGANSSATYANPAQKYQPDTTTDEEKGQASFTYNTAGNATKAKDITPVADGGPGPTAGQEVSYGRAGDPGVASCGGRTGQTGQVCTITDGRGNVTTNAYNSLGQLITVTPPSPLGATSYTYDTANRVATRTDGKSQVTRYSYDPLDRLTQTRYAGTTTCTGTDITNGLCITNSYDDDGNRLTQIDQTGTTATGYDLLSRETSRNLPGAGITGGTSTLTFDAAGNVATATDPYGTTTYTYDTANQLTKIAEPGGNCTAPATIVRCTTFTYDNNGGRLTTTYPTSPSTTIITNTLDKSGRATKIEVKTGSTVRQDLRYTYQTAPGSPVSPSNPDHSLVLTRTDMLTGGASGTTTSYDYDSQQRLLTALEKNTAGTTTANWTYSYDKAGNRETATLNPAGTGATTAFTYNAANQIATMGGSATGFSYDANGNETAALGSSTRTAQSWNNKDQLTGGTVNSAAATFTYSGPDQFTRLSFNSATFRNTALGITARNQSSATTAFIREPQGGLIALRTGTAGSGSSYYYTFDNLGSVTGLLNNTGAYVNTYTYDPYGQTRSQTETVTNFFKYTGQTQDAGSGLYKLGIRYYDPTLGRFTQTDPTGQDDHYTYVSNSPTNGTDPSGSFGFSLDIEACFGLCIELGVTLDEDGDIGGSGYVGASPVPSIGGGLSSTTDDVSGNSVEANAGCQAGPFSGTVTAGTGGVSGSAGVGVYTPGCSGSVGGTVQLGSLP